MREWSNREGIPVGVIVPVRVLDRLTRDWYRDRLSRDWRPRTAEAAERRFALAGLTGPFWSLR